MNSSETGGDQLTDGVGKLPDEIERAPSFVDQEIGQLSHQHADDPHQRVRRTRQ